MDRNEPECSLGNGNRGSRKRNDEFPYHVGCCNPSHLLDFGHFVCCDWVPEGISGGIILILVEWRRVFAVRCGAVRRGGPSDSEPVMC